MIYTYSDGDYRALAPAGVNVRDHGATGDGTTDDTAAINAAIDFAVASGVRTVVVPDGVYMIQAHDPNWTVEQSQNVVFYTHTFPGGIKMKSGIHLKLSQGATLRAIPNNAKWYRIVGAAEVSDVEISGGTIEGDRAAHIGANGGEWGHGISLVAVTDAYVHDLTVKDCWGDGINTNLSEMNVAAPCRRIRVERVVCDNNRRQGMSISSVVDMTVADSDFSNTIGTWPAAGIDIESNSGTSPTTDITITRCRFNNNNGSGVCVVDGYGDRITVTDCRFSGNKGGGENYPGQVYFNVQTTRSYRVTGNWFAAPGAATCRNVRLSGGTNVEVSGNVATGGAFWGTGLSDTRIERNTIAAAPTTAPAVELTNGSAIVADNRVTGGSVGVALTGATSIDRATIARNRISGATGAAVSVTAPTSNVLVKDNEAWSNGAGAVFDTAKTHTAHSIESNRMDGADTLPT